MHALSYAANKIKVRSNRKSPAGPAAFLFVSLLSAKTEKRSFRPVIVYIESFGRANYPVLLVLDDGR